MPKIISLIQKIDHQTIEKQCLDLEIREVFTDDRGNYWGFQKNCPMAIPLEQKSTIKFEWDANYTEDRPFELPEICTEINFQLPWKYKVVWKYFFRLTTVCVRTDVYPIAWIYWYIYFRIEESLLLIGRSLIRLLEIWGLATIAGGQFPHWKDIKIIKRYLNF